MYCKFCGKEIGDAAFCPFCGKEQVEHGAQTEGNVPPPYGAPPPRPREVDAPNAGFAVLGFFFPLIGLILYLVWKDSLPLRARSCGKGALIGVIVQVACYVLVFCLSMIFVSIAMHGPAVTGML